jgi:peroxiredoxin Q/BCP
MSGIHLLKPGTPAPQFSLPVSDGSLLQSSDYIGRKPVVIFFYPKDGTFGCTVEACAFRDAHAEFVAAGAEVIGISADPVTSHLRFQEKHSLPFVLASDVGNETARA